MAVARGIESDGGRVLAVTGDLTDASHVARIRTAVERGLGPTSILVANAGGSPVPPGPLEDLSEADWRRSVDVNLTATFLTVKEFLPGMKTRGGCCIITMSSAASRRPTAHSPGAYAAAKAGIETLTKSLALQAGPAGVRVNCLAPETILTERNQQMIPDDVKEQLRRTHPLQRLGTPEDVAEAALYLASDRSAWVSGITIDVAGGSVLVS
jgi:3-oxoacyl-[acyl-carrier protein] reductase